MMQDHPLLNAVANWPGRVSTQLAFEARGFSVHKAWQNRVIEFCGEQQADAEATRVPPSWHGWLHHTVDIAPTEESYTPRE
jgi:NADH:ubiquinone oxidoreductase subunit